MNQSRISLWRILGGVTAGVGILLSTAAAAGDQTLLDLTGPDDSAITLGNNGSGGFIQIASFSWGISRPTGPGSGSGGKEGKVDLSDFSFTFVLNSSYLNLFKALVDDEKVKAVVDLTKTIDGKNDLYFQMIFSGGLLDSLRLTGLGDQVPAVQASLAYEDVSFEYFPISPITGALTAPPLFASYDLLTGTGNPDELLVLYALGQAGPGGIVSPVPEPETYAMILAGLAVIGFVAIRRRRRPGHSS